MNMGMQNQFGLLEFSAIGEMANIGLGHATTALSEIAGKPFNMSIPSVESVALEQAHSLTGGPDELIVCTYMPFDGDANGHTAFLFPWKGACELWETLLGSHPENPEMVDELYASAMLEVGNILNSNFLNAIADMADVRMAALPPSVSIDSAMVILNSLVAEAEMNERVALAIETTIHPMDADEVQGVFLCIPDLKGLQVLFRKLGIEEAA